MKGVIMKINKYNQTVSEYVDLKKQELEIKEKLSKISNQVTSWTEEVLSNTDEKTIELPEGDSLTLVINKDWQYPAYIKDEVKKLNEKVNKARKIYQIKNPDKFEPKTSVRFKEGQ